MARKGQKPNPSRTASGAAGTPAPAETQPAQEGTARRTLKWTIAGVLVVAVPLLLGPVHSYLTNETSIAITNALQPIV